MKKILFLSAMLLGAVSLTAKDIKTIVFTTTPQMHCFNCEEKIKKNIRFEKGVKNIVTNVAEQRVEITYDADKTTPEKLQKGFKKIGYDAKILKDGEKVAKDNNEKCEMM